jgi:3-oxoacyl-[acyl-carrier protein] reductase
MGELHGKVAIVTGAGRLRGIGRGAAVAFAKLGADVVVTGTGRDPASFPPDEKEVGWRDIESSAEQVRELGTRALPLIVDVASEDDVQMMVDRTMEEFGRIDILVNNAAYARGPDRVPLLELDPAILQKVLDVKIKGTFLCSKAVARVLIDQGEGGKIVNISSSAGKKGIPRNLPYNAACFAQVGMTQSLAKELAPYKINVNCVCPGAVDTSRVDDVGRGEEWDEMIETKIPLGRAGTDEEVGAIIAYLCTKATSWITGQSINVDGGGVMEH